MFFSFLILIGFSGWAQKDSLLVEPGVIVQEPIQKEKKYEPYNALAPSKAAFYSAILPGLGQAYNGSWWKIPIAYGGLGTGIYFYLDNDKQYDRYRDAYKNRISDRPDEFQGRISTDALIRAQQFYQKNKEISILVTVGIYVLNIVDANVEAHLRQFNVNDDLTFKPNLDQDFIGNTNYGLSLNFNF
nr:DUF5683 domain-containing protein [Gramella sp. AN32]